jgi:gamma-glutamyl-gamma-aminobutyraldehyde dehydrogenase
MDATTPNSAADWHARARALELPRRALIDGRFVDAQGGATFRRDNPATGQTLAEVAECGADDVDRAVRAARDCFEAGTWRDLAPDARKAAMLRWAELIRQNQDELALLESLEAGKPIADTSSADIPACAATLAWYAECADKLYDAVAPTPPGSHVTITREPIGVVAAVIPWNYASIILSWKLGPALAAGNSVILKPAEQSPFAALRIGQLALEAGIPPGALQVLTGRGPVTGEAIGLHGDIDAVAFTGSADVGKRFLSYAAQSNMKRIALECGGKSPQIVTRDCGDLDAAAESITYGIWYNAGQTCHAGSRLIVERPVKDALMDKLAGWAPKFAPGDPLDPGTTMGALIEPEAVQKVENAVEVARQAGAEIPIGGRRTGLEGGSFYAPTVVDGVRPDADIAREEVFGPVLTVLDADGLDDAIRIANDSRYGLAAAVWTDKLADAHRAARALKAGTVWVNTYDESSPVTPFGGFKESGIGRDRSLHAFDKYTEVKTTWVKT